MDVRNRHKDWSVAGIGVGLVMLFGFGMESLLSQTGREYFPVVRLDERNGVDDSFTDAYSRIPRFRDLLKNISAVRQEALSRAQSRLGMLVVDPARYVVRFKDTLGCDDCVASGRSVRAEKGDVYLVTLSVLQYINGLADAQSILVHEFVHGAMREHMGERLYRSLPHWAKEGIAVWAAQQLPERCDNAIEELLKKEDGPMLAAEGRSRFSPKDEYIRDAVPFDYVEENFGKEAMVNVLSQLMKGRNPRYVFEKATGMDWEELEVRFDRYLEQCLSSAAERNGLGRLKEILEKMQTQGCKEVVMPLEDYLARFPQSNFLPQALFWMGSCSFETGRYELAMVAFLRLQQVDRMSLRSKATNREWMDRTFQEMALRYPAKFFAMLAMQ